MEADDFLEFATYSGNRYGTLRSEVERCARRPGTRWCSRSRSRARSRSARRCRESVQIFIAPAGPRPSAPPARGSRAPTRPRRSTRGSRPPNMELAAQGDFDHRIVNDDLIPRCGRAGGDRARRGRLTSRLRAPNDQTTRRQAPRARRLALRRGRRRRQEGTTDKQLLPQPRRGQLRRVPAADGRDPAATGTTSRWRSRSLPRASSNTSTAPSAGARGADLRRNRWPESCSASVVGSPPTRRWSSPAWRPSPATACGC